MKVVEAVALQREMQACTIEKDFRKALEPAKEFAYEDVPALELAF